MAAQAGQRNLITDVAGILVGQAEDRAAISGTTVVLAEAPAVASVDVRGGAPGGRETELLAPAVLSIASTRSCCRAALLSGSTPPPV